MVRGPITVHRKFSSWLGLQTRQGGGVGRGRGGGMKWPGIDSIDAGWDMTVFINPKDSAGCVHCSVQSILVKEVANLQHSKGLLLLLR